MMPVWRLMIGGSNSATYYDDWASRQAEGGASPILFDGFVDEETRSASPCSRELPKTTWANRSGWAADRTPGAPALVPVRPSTA